jgi:hypothetical protein
MRLLAALFALLFMSGCALVMRVDHFNPSSDHGELQVYRHAPPKETIFLAGENFRLKVYAAALTSEVAWFGPLIPIFPGVLLGNMADDTTDRDERLTILVAVAEYRSSFSLNLEEVLVYVGSDNQALRPSIVERACRRAGSDEQRVAVRVSGVQTLNEEEERTRQANDCSNAFRLSYGIERRGVESFEVRFGQVVANGVVSTPEPIRFKRSVDHWFLGVP